MLKHPSVTTQSLHSQYKRLALTNFLCKIKSSVRINIHQTSIYGWVQSQVNQKIVCNFSPVLYYRFFPPSTKMLSHIQLFLLISHKFVQKETWTVFRKGNSNLNRGTNEKHWVCAVSIKQSCSISQKQKMKDFPVLRVIQVFILLDIHKIYHNVTGRALTNLQFKIRIGLELGKIITHFVSDCILSLL